MRYHAKRRELPITTRIAYFIYQIAYHFALPLIGVLALWRARKEPGHLHNLSPVSYTHLTLPTMS